MALTLYAHPFSSYCQKVLIALFENEIPFSFCTLGAPDSPANIELARHWPLKRMPLLLDGELAVMEATIIIEHLDLKYPGRQRWLPQDPEVALEVRFLDRFFDNYIHAPMQAIVGNALRAPEQRNAKNVADAQALLKVSYRWLEERMANREWAAANSFTLADCAAAPALFYADWVQRIDAGIFPRVAAYRQRLNARPSFARAIEAARPFRPLFPLGAPDRD